MPFEEDTPPSLIAEIIAIGSELTTGAKLDTNSRWLSEQLAAIGIPVTRHVTVADDLAAMLQVLQDACSRADIVLVTGGLGPTLDDLTRQAFALLLGTELSLHEESLEYIRALFLSRGRTMPERNIVQAMFPEGARPLENPIGTAPGIYAEVPRDGKAGSAHVAALPGVPVEMQMMFAKQVLPLLPAGANVIRNACIHCFGLGESHTEELLGDITARGRDPEVGITAHEATITLRITAAGHSVDDCEARIERTRRMIRERLGEAVFGEGDDELEHVLVSLLSQHRLTLSSAESGTGGLLAHRLTDVPGFEACYLGGVVVPTPAAKSHLLAVPQRLVGQHGPISREVAAAMAEGCRKAFDTDFALAVTDQLLDTPMPSQPAFVALADKRQVRAVELPPIGNSSIQKSRTTKAAMNLLRLYLLRADVSAPDPPARPEEG